MHNDFYKLEYEARKEELNYRLTGDFERLCKRNFEINKKINALVNGFDCQENLQKNSYNNILKYVGDLEQRYNIEMKEKHFRSIRKQIPHKEYEKRLRELVLLRNEFAKTAGFRNYLEYKYSMWGVDKEILTRKMDKTYTELLGTTGSQEYISLIKRVNNFPILNDNNQRQLLEQMLDLWKLELEKGKVKIHTDDLPQFYIGACVPVSIPEDIHVLMNLQSGLSGFAVFMHEIGHAYYYSNISNRLPIDRQCAVNLIAEEGVALLFENLTYTSYTTKNLLGIELDIYDNLIDAFAMYQMCCIEFEERIYSQPYSEFDTVWSKLREKYVFEQDSNWCTPHFFVSEPGYFAAYFLGNRLAKDIYSYVKRKQADMNDFLIGHICSLGGNLQFDGVLKEINF